MQIVQISKQGGETIDALSALWKEYSAEEQYVRGGCVSNTGGTTKGTATVSYEQSVAEKASRKVGSLGTRNALRVEVTAGT